jgi:hypothetical protein
MVSKQAPSSPVLYIAPEFANQINADWDSVMNNSWQVWMNSLPPAKGLS